MAFKPPLSTSVPICTIEMEVRRGTPQIQAFQPNKRRIVMKTLLEALPVRERPVWRVAYQADGCSMVELLATIVGGSHQLEISHELMTRFGSVRAISKATCDELAAIDGIGTAGASRLRAALELSRLLSAPDQDNPPTINSPEDAAALMMYRMQSLEQEHMFVILLNTRNHVIGDPVLIYRGTLNSTSIRMAELLRPAVRANAASIILMHNHPSGDPTPSPEDVHITRSIVDAGKMLDLQILDHIIIGQGRFTSLKAKRLGFD
jgi:DNA repair protein RadC